MAAARVIENVSCFEEFVGGNRGRGERKGRHH